MQNYLKTATRPKRRALIVLLIGIALMAIYVFGIVFLNTIPSWKTQTTAWIDAEPLRALGTLLGIGLSIFLLGFLCITRGLVLYHTYVPNANTPATKNTLLKDILAINDTKTPYTVTQDGDILRVTFKIAEAKWYVLFGKAGMKKHYQLTIRLDEKNHTVYGIETMRTLNWSASVPRAALVGSFWRGWSFFDAQIALAYGIKDINPITVGQLYNYKYNTNTIRFPVINAALKNGWTFKPAPFSVRLGI